VGVGWLARVPVGWRDGKPVLNDPKSDLEERWLSAAWEEL